MGFLFVILFIICLNIMVLVHEAGHFITARRVGIKVFEFSVGFGPRLWGFEKNGIKYSIRAVLFGGYVKLAGLDQALEGEPTDSKDDPGSIHNKPLWAKVLTIFMAPFLNILMAVVMFVLIFRFLGIPSMTDEPIIGQVQPHFPAYYAGLREGDRIIQVDSQKIKTWTEFAKYVHNAGSRTLSLKIERGGKQLVVKVPTEYNPKHKIWLIGVEQQIAKLDKKSWKESIQMAVSLPGRFVILLANMIISREKLGVMGPVGAVGWVSGLTGQWGFYRFIMILAQISLTLGIVNLLPLPLPLLDGGWIVIFVLEKLRGKPFSEKAMGYAQMIGFFLIIVGLLVIPTLRDIFGNVVRFINSMKNG